MMNIDNNNDNVINNIDNDNDNDNNTIEFSDEARRRRRVRPFSCLILLRSRFRSLKFRKKVVKYKFVILCCLA